MLVLVIRSPWNQSREHVLAPGRATLGRKSDNAIVIQDDLASRRHAEIECDPAAETARVRDLGSTNGTYVNRERVTGDRPLLPGDQIRIGHHQLTLTVRSNDQPELDLPATRPVTRDLVLQSMDQHALVLYEMARHLNTILDIETALSELSRLAGTALGADRCQIIPAQRFDQIAELGFPTSIANQAIGLRSAVFEPDLPAEGNAAPNESRVLLQVRSVLCVPGLLNEHVAVLVYAFRSGPAARPFDLKDLQLAVAVSHHAALVMQRAELIDQAQRLQQLASTDDLTGLPNRRHLFEAGQHEIERARRHRRPLAAMMIDLDNFKAVNDYGHAVGDLALVKVAGGLRDNLREGHLIARYGGDEFVVLLPECDLHGANRVAERVTQRVTQLYVDTPDGPVYLSISTGCAVLTDTCPSLAALVNAADITLTAAKLARRGSPPTAPLRWTPAAAP